MRSHVALLCAAVMLVSCSEDPALRERESRLGSLRAEHEALRRRLESRLKRNPPVAVPAIAETDIAIGIDAESLARSVSAAAECYFERIDLDLSDQLAVSEEGDASVKILVGKIGAGHWKVDLAFPHLVGVLQAGPPSISAGINALDVAIPVRLVEGHGDATAALSWEATTLSSLVCGDFHHEIRAQGRAVPNQYLLLGRLVLGLGRDGPIVSSVMYDDHFHLDIVVDEPSYRRVRTMISQQSEERHCGLILDEAKAEDKLRGFIERGFNVRLPRELESAFALPTRFASEVEVLGHAVAVEVDAAEPTLDQAALWSGARVKVRKR